MAVTILNQSGIFTTAAGDLPAAKSFSFTPNLNDLIVVIVAQTGGIPTFTVTDNNADGLGVYTSVRSALKGTSADKMTAFVRTSFVGSATATAFTTTGMTGSTGGGIQVVTMTGMSRVGSFAVRNGGNVDNQTTGTTPTVTLTLTPLTTNPLIGYLFNATNGILTAGPSGWTSFTGAGYNTPTTGIRGTDIISGWTNGTVAWGGTSASDYAALVVEFDASVPPGTATPPKPVIVTQVAMHHAVRAAKLSYGWTRNKSGLLIPEMGWS